MEIEDGNYEKAANTVPKIKEIENKDFLIQMINVCSSQDNRIEHIKRTLLHTNIYSFGTFYKNEKKCPGFLSETTIENGSGLGKSTIYFLYGYDDCSSFYWDEIDNPEENYNAILPGDYLKNTLKYNGIMPKTWVYKNREYDFYTTHLAKD